VIDEEQMPCRAATRADAQRDRILCAAFSCFIEHGFHAASMASIAEAAQMSAGLIYRYFENKSAIVLAIVERQLEGKRHMIRAMQSTEQLVDNLVRAFEEWRSRGNGGMGNGAMSVALILEMTAEATRNPQMAEALHRADALTHAEFEDWLCRPRSQGGVGMSKDVAARRAASIRLVIEGLLIRAAREPELKSDTLREVLEDVLTPLLEPNCRKAQAVSG
jgi:AcrR family transcriptional regulator